MPPAPELDSYMEVRIFAATGRRGGGEEAVRGFFPCERLVYTYF
jgi:hypothetical protein